MRPSRHDVRYDPLTQESRPIDLAKVRHDLDYSVRTLAYEIENRRYESAAQTAEMIVKLAKAADRLAYVPGVKELSLKEVYGV